MREDMAADEGAPWIETPQGGWFFVNALLVAPELVVLFPLVAGLPFGLVPGFIPLMSMPTKITLEFQKPITWPRLDATDTRDPKTLIRCYNQVVDVMQQALWRLANERPNPFSRR